MLDDFFAITYIETDVPQHYRISVAINASHSVYAGHFPENPVVPGVCALHVITKCVEKILGYPVFLHRAPGIKFLGILRPEVDKYLSIDIIINNVDNSMIKATITSSEKLVMSCKLQLSKMPSAVA